MCPRRPLLDAGGHGRYVKMAHDCGAEVTARCIMKELPGTRIVTDLFGSLFRRVLFDVVSIWGAGMWRANRLPS